MKIGIGHAIGSVHLDPIIHSSPPTPTVFNDAQRAVFEFQNATGFVLSPRSVGVNIGTHLAVYGLNLGAAEKPVTKCNSVATEVHQRTTTAAIHIPEPCGMRPKMFFALFDEM